MRKRRVAMGGLLAFALTLLATSVRAAAPLTLQQALETASSAQPLLRQAHADLAATRASADASLSGLLPQVSLSSGYQFGPSRQNVNQAGLPLTNLGNYSIGLSADQLLYDFGQAHARYRASLSQVTAQDRTAAQVVLEVRQTVRTAFVTVQTCQALVTVAQDTLTNRAAQQTRIRHLVEVGLRSPIDLAQATKDVTKARLSLVNAQRDDAVAKAALNQAMGVAGPTDYVVATDPIGPVAGEDGAGDVLVQEAIAHRPDLAAMAAQVQAQTLVAEAADHAGFPSLKASTGAGTNGALTSTPELNWNAGIGLSWPIYAGGEAQANAAQERAALAGLQAKTDLLRQQIRLAVEQARLAVTTAKEAVGIAREVTTEAHRQLTLAEGRYAAGLGSVLELGTAQQAYTDARAQEVEEAAKLATARAQLLLAIGRD